jgi:hypothetical protein
MDAERFDRWTRLFGERLSRRRIGAILLALGVVGAEPVHETVARHKHKHKKPKKKCKHGTIKCGKHCINPKTDALNCGGCDIRCFAGVACVDGQCGGTCRDGQIRCGDALCVDPNSNEDHCGGCNHPCTGDLTCLEGDCGCADSGDTQCGDECFDLQTDDDHCGRCDKTCGDTERCQGGECVATGCAADEIECGGGLCIPDVPTACCDQNDCGGDDTYATDLVCNTTTHRCECREPGAGICFQDEETGAGRCDVCCEGGSGECPGDYVCRTDFISHPSCDCAAGSEHCPYSPYGTCSHDMNTDDHRCTINCVDCDDVEPGSICCGVCVRGCAPGTYSFTCLPPDRPCGPDCAPCGEGKMCCNSGPGTGPSCVIPTIDGRCPG